MAKKSVEMVRYGSKDLRNKNLQKKVINYGLKKITAVVQKVGSEALDQYCQQRLGQIKNLKPMEKIWMADLYNY